MAERLSERLDFILAYGVEGNADVDELRKNLEGVESSGEAANEKMLEMRETLQKKLNAEHQSAQATGQLAEKQMDLSKAASQSNEVVRDVAIGLEILKTEMQEGEITQEQYAQGLQELRNRLDNLDVITLSSARSQRMLAQEQAKATNQMTRSRGAVRGAVPAFTSLSQIVQDLPFGFIAISNNIPFAATQLQNLSQRAGGSKAALSAVMGVLTGPGGMVLALTALIPLIAVATQKYDLFNSELWDTKEAATAANEALKDIRERFTEAAGLEGAEALRRQLELINDQIEAAEQMTGRRPWWERAVLWMGRFTAQNEANRVAMQALHSDAATREKFINGLLEEREKIRARLFGLTLAEENTAGNLQEMYAEMLENHKKANEEFQKMMADFEIEVPDVVGETDRSAELEAQEQATARRHAEIGRMRMRFEQQLQQQIFENQLHGLTLRRQLALQEEREIQEIRDNAVISERQRQEMITEIQRNFAMQRADIVEQEEETKRLERQLTNDMAMDLLMSLDGLGEVVFGNSEKRARQAFEMNKALALGTAIVQGARAVVEALPNIKRALIAGGIAAIQIAKIAATKFRGGGRGGSSESQNVTFAYRGFDAQQENTGVARRESEPLPDRLKLVDPSGRLLTEMEYDRDSRGDSPYLVERDR